MRRSGKGRGLEGEKGEGVTGGSSAALATFRVLSCHPWLVTGELDDAYIDISNQHRKFCGTTQG